MDFAKALALVMLMVVVWVVLFRFVLGYSDDQLYRSATWCGVFYLMVLWHERRFKEARDG